MISAIIITTTTIMAMRMAIGKASRRRVTSVSSNVARKGSLKALCVSMGSNGQAFVFELRKPCVPKGYPGMMS
jgi:hypothetical protein